MLATLLLTLLIESVVVVGYARHKGGPQAEILHLLTATALANLGTQPLLWLVLRHWVAEYMTVLLLGELCIWILEGVALYFYPFTKLRWMESLCLSLAMNGSSFGIGWFLPV